MERLNFNDLNEQNFQAILVISSNEQKLSSSDWAERKY